MIRSEHPVRLPLIGTQMGLVQRCEGEETVEDEVVRVGFLRDDDAPYVLHILTDGEDVARYC